MGALVAIAIYLFTFGVAIKISTLVMGRYNRSSYTSAEVIFFAAFWYLFLPTLLGYLLAVRIALLFESKEDKK